MMFKPMLASTLEKGSVPAFPILISPKLDGIRAMVIDGVLVSRNLKPIPNHHCQMEFGREEYNGLDGELIVGEPNSSTCFRDTTSGVMTASGCPPVRFFVFDDFSDPNLCFDVRIGNARHRTKNCDHVEVVAHNVVTNVVQMQTYEAKYLEAGYEGAMLRAPGGLYKFGRSTNREGWLIKVKRFADDEAIIVGFDEQLHNANELQKDNLGRAKRTSHKENKRAKGTLGSLRVMGVTGPFKQVYFDIGTGFDDNLRQEIWDNQQDFIGKIVKFKYFPSGSKDKPRFPTFLGFRHLVDL